MKKIKLKTKLACKLPNQFPPSANIQNLKVPVIQDQTKNTPKFKIKK